MMFNGIFMKITFDTKKKMKILIELIKKNQLPPYLAANFY